MDKELERKSKDPSTTSEAYATMAPRWALMDALLGGTETMRAAGEEYLPRHQEEEQVGYQDRLASAVLYNMTEHTLENLVGRPFREDPEVSTDTPAAVRALLDDVDLQGNALGPFCRSWFRTGLAKAFCGVLVDYPRKDEAITTKEDEARAGLRPYWILVTPENIIDAKVETVAGVKKLTHLRIMETYQEAVGFASVTKRRIRVLEPGTVRFFEEVTGTDGKTDWNEGDTFQVGIQDIPFSLWYSAAKDGELLAKPRLQDLAELNKCHWQSTADQRHILTVCRFPILACSGANGPTATAGEDEGDGIVIGPNKVVYIGEPTGRLYYVEHTGASVAAGERDLQNLERQMASYGAQFLTEKTGTETATAAAIDSAESTSELASMAKTFEDAVAQAFWFTAQWLGIKGDSAGRIVLDSSWSKKPEVTPKDGKKDSTPKDHKQGDGQIPMDMKPGEMNQSGKDQQS